MTTNWAKFQIKLDSISLSESAETPTRIPICAVGTFFKGKRKFTVTRKDVATLAENFSKRGNGEVVIDYEHAAENPDVAMGGPVPAAGWIVGLDATPDANGIVWGSAKFTERAAEMLKASEYKFGSPVLNWGVRDKDTGEAQGITLTSYALTNTPVLDQMPAIRLSEAAKEEGQMADKEVMCSEHPKTAMVCPQCEPGKFAGSAAVGEGPKVLQLSEVKRDARGRIDVALLGEGAVSGAVITAIETQRVALSEVDTAVREGRITPAQRDHFEKIALSDIATFRGVTQTMKAVDLTTRGHGGGGEGVTALSEVAQIDDKLHQLALSRAEKDKIGYGAALKLVGAENRDLDRQRTQIMRASTRVAEGEE